MAPRGCSEPASPVLAAAALVLATSCLVTNPQPFPERDASRPYLNAASATPPISAIIDTANAAPMVSPMTAIALVR